MKSDLCFEGSRPLVAPFPPRPAPPLPKSPALPRRVAGKLPAWAQPPRQLAGIAKLPAIYGRHCAKTRLYVMARPYMADHAGKQANKKATARLWAVAFIQFCLSLYSRIAPIILPCLSLIACRIALG